MAAITAPAFQVVDSIEQLPSSKPGGVVVFDLDETLIQGKPILGNEPFYNWLAQQCYADTGRWIPHYEWTTYLRQKITYEPCESSEKVNAVFARIREQGSEIIGLTSRGIDMKEMTKRHLEESNINLDVGKVIFKQLRGTDGQLLGKNEHLLDWKQTHRKEKAVDFLCVDDDAKRALKGLQELDRVDGITMTCVQMEHSGRPKVGTLPPDDLKRLAVQLAAYKRKEEIPYGVYSAETLSQAKATLEIEDCSDNAIYRAIKKIAEDDGRPFQKPLVLFTDPGEDVDDFLALILAATSKEFQLKGVISANEDSDGNVACFARQILDHLGKSDVPVYEGEQGKTPNFLCENAVAIPRQDQEYLPKLEELMHTYQKVHVLGIAAMTGMAKLTEAPWFQKERFSFYQMGGNTKQGEYNLRGDPVAARKVLESGSEIHLITSNTTIHPEMQLTPKSEIRRLMDTEHPLFELLRKNWDAFVAHYKQRGYYPYPHDAVAFSAMEKTSFVDFENKKIRVLDDGKIVETEDGVSVYVSNPEVEAEKFQRYLKGRLEQVSGAPSVSGAAAT